SRRDVRQQPRVPPGTDGGNEEDRRRSVVPRSGVAAQRMGLGAELSRRRNGGCRGDRRRGQSRAAGAGGEIPRPAARNIQAPVQRTVLREREGSRVAMTRRDLGKLATAGALLQARAARGQSAAAKYTGALDGFESKVDAKNFDPVAFTYRLYDAAP